MKSVFMATNNFWIVLHYFSLNLYSSAFISGFFLENFNRIIGFKVNKPAQWKRDDDDEEEVTKSPL